MASLGRKALVKSNLDLWLNDLFIRNGLYTNVADGDVDLYGRNISSLVASSDPSFDADNTIFQSPFKNWVHESGVTSAESGVAAPIIASGVTVDGTFYLTATTVGAYAHIIDYPNGRVIFDTALAGSPSVSTSYSYKDVTVDFADSFNNENMPLKIEMSYKDNPAQTGVDIYPVSDERTLPAVFVDILNRQSTPYEIGTRNSIANFICTLHVWARDDFQLDMIEDILTEEDDQVILGINFNTAPYPLLSRGEKNPLFTSYANLAQLWTSSFWRRIYLIDIETRKDTPLFEVERSRINFTARVYPNF